MQDQHHSEDTPARQGVWKLFDRIAHRYDLLNRLLSMGCDCWWRRKMVGQFPKKQNLRVLDLATGTGDVLFSIQRRFPKLAMGVGLDMSQGMLAQARQKWMRRENATMLHLVRGDATALTFPDASFDAASISFGIRNVIDTPKGLREIYRVLTPEGRALILEFSLPANALIRRFYLFYFRHILPRIGAWLSGDAYAYTYLNRTVETYPYGDAFCQLLADAGFEKVTAQPLTFGIATLYIADKTG